MFNCKECTDRGVCRAFSVRSVAPGCSSWLTSSRSCPCFAHQYRLNNKFLSHFFFSFFNDGDKPSRGTRFARRTVPGTIAHARASSVQTSRRLAQFPSIESQSVELTKRRATRSNTFKATIARSMTRDLWVFDDEGWVWWIQKRIRAFLSNWFHFIKIMENSFSSFLRFVYTTGLVDWKFRNERKIYTRNSLRIVTHFRNFI